MTQKQLELVREAIGDLINRENFVSEFLQTYDMKKSDNLSDDDNERLCYYRKNNAVRLMVFPLCEVFFMVHSVFDDGVKDTLVEFLQWRLKSSAYPGVI